MAETSTEVVVELRGTMATGEVKFRRKIEDRSIPKRESRGKDTRHCGTCGFV